MLDSLVPDTDKIPEMVRIALLQRAVQKKHDLRQINVLYTVRSTFEVCYDLLWYQHDLNNAAGQKKRQAFISQQVDSFDESEPDHGEDTPLNRSLAYGTLLGVLW